MKIFCCGCKMMNNVVRRWNGKTKLSNITVSTFKDPRRSIFTWNATIEHYVDNLVHEYQRLNEKLLNPQDLDPTEMKKFSTHINKLRPTMDVFKKLQEKREELLEVATMAVMDLDFEKLVEEESKQYRDEIQELESRLIDLIIPSDVDDGSNAVLEVRAGTGGREAAIFAAEIFSMYSKFSSVKKWKFEVLTESVNTEGGLKEASASISGNSVFAFLKHEVGVHRVQRIPVTEAAGRVHTSTISVAVLPEPEDVNVVLDMKDVKVDTYRASGAGGQHVNTTDSAVRVTHLPTGITVTMQDERSQTMNKSKALRLLTARLYNLERNRTMEKRSKERKLQIGSALRSERIRTYNFSQDRITDHRIGVTIHGVEEFLNAGQNLDEVIENLRKHEKLLSIENLSNMKPAIRM